MKSLSCLNSFSNDPTNAILPSELRLAMTSYYDSKCVLSSIYMSYEVRELHNKLNANFEITANKALAEIKSGYELIHQSLAVEALLKTLDADGTLWKSYINKFGASDAKDSLYQEYAHDLSKSASEIAHLNYIIAKNICEEQGGCSDAVVELIYENAHDATFNANAL